MTEVLLCSSDELSTVTVDNWICISFIIIIIIIIIILFV